jgi:peptide/nickel transport system substrate-binding protein
VEYDDLPQPRRALVTRRQVVRGLALGGAVVALAGPLAACTAAPATAPASTPSSAPAGAPKTAPTAAAGGSQAGAPKTAAAGTPSSGQAAAPPTTATGTPKRGGVFTVVIDADPPSLNPMTSQVNQTFWPSNQIYDTLVKYDKDFNPMPWLAKSWNISPDGKTFTFDLVSGVKWHDGTPFTSADVSYLFKEAGPSNSNIYGLVMKELQDVDDKDPNKIVLQFGQPVGALMAYLGDPNFNILPRHVYAGSDPKTNPANSQPIGTGPFKFKEWARGDHLTLERNPDYWQSGLPYVDQVVFRFVNNPAAAVSSLEQGGASFVFTLIQPVDAQRLKNSRTVVTAGPSVLARTLDLWPNMRNKPLDNLQVRQALSLAVDRERMVSDVAFGQTRTARGPIGSLSPYFDASLPELPRDVVKANQLLDQAGLARGAGGTRFPLKLLVVSSQAQFVKTSEIVKENLADVGVAVEILAGETTTTLDAIFKRWEFDLAVYSMPLGPEPSLQLPAWLGTEGQNRAYFSNAEGYSNKLVDDLTAEAQRTVDRAQRGQLYNRIQQQIMADLPLIPLWEPIFISGYGANWMDAFTAPDDRYVSFAGVWNGA